MPFRKTFTKHLLDGRQVPAGTAGAIEVKQTSKVWYAKIDGKLVSLGTDFRKAESYEKAHRGQAEREAHGLADPFAVHRTRPLAEHLEDFRKAMTGANATAAHVDQKIGRIKAMFDGCGFKTVDDVDATRVSEWLSLKRAGGTEFELPAKMTEFEPRQAVALLNVSGTALRAKIKRLGLPATGHGKARKYPRATLQAVLEADAKGIGPATCNHYLVAARSFLNWMRRNRRIAFNPLDTLKLLNERGDVRRNRRELDAAELKALLAATRASTRSYRGMDGEARFHLYLTAFVTGYRASGLSKLTPDDFHLDGDLPVITLATRHNKFQRRMMTQPVPPFAVDTLKAYVADKPAAVPLWGGTWAKDHKGAEMLRGDLAAAGIPYTVDGPGGIEYRDFHALRHGLLTHEIGRAHV